MAGLSEMGPDEIRAIRDRLGLTQAEAGELIGGGPRAFTKYEAGTVTPAASVVNLLRVLDSNPDALQALSPRKPLPTAAGMLSPFEVSGDHVAVLTKEEMPELLRRLLQVEATEHGLQAASIHVPSNIDAQDGGEDGRITWEGDPQRTAFLPGRRCHFQLKAGAIPPARAGKEVLTKDSTVKNMVRAALAADGHYIMLCAYPYTQKAIEAREAQIRNALRRADLTVVDDRIHFLDADKIAEWVNRYPSVATWLKEGTAPGTIGPFRSWSQWTGRSEHEQSPWVDDERLRELRPRLQARVATTRSVTRVVGFPSVGKSRLVIEALRPDVATEERGISDFVLYAVVSEVGGETTKRAVQNLADHGQRAIVVVDDCDAETHEVLARLASRAGSALSLITIDNEIPEGTLDPGAVINVVKAPDSVTEAVILQLLPTVPSEDHRRLARFSRGFPGIAIRIAQAWDQSVPLANAAENELVDAFVLGRHPQQPEALVKSAQLLATFGIVGVDPPADGQLAEVASYASDLSADDFYSACVTLADRGVAQRRGRAVVLQSGPIAMKLAERQWKAWRAPRRDDILAGGASPYLKVQAARRLALLNMTEVAAQVVQHVCRIDGPLDGFEAASRSGHPELLPHLAEISPAVVANWIDRILDDATDLQRVEGNLRRNIVRALERIAFHPDTFEDGAILLLRLAVEENEAWSNNATGQFTGLFPMFGGGTAAGAAARLSLLDKAMAPDDTVRLRIVAEALGAGCQTRSVMRRVGPESQGSRPALEPWFPTTKDDATEYLRACVTRLEKLALRHDDVVEVARRQLSTNLEGLIGMGLVDSVEEVVLGVAQVDYWPQAAARLRNVLASDSEGMDGPTKDRVSALLEELRPRSMDARVRSTVTDVPWDYHTEGGSEAHRKRAVEAVRRLAKELIAQPVVLHGYLPQLSQGTRQTTRDFGEALAALVDGSAEWLEHLVQAVIAVPARERRFDLLAGYVAWLATNRPDAAEAFKRRAARSTELAPALPQLCVEPGVSPSDVELMVDALRADVLPPVRLGYLGGVFAGLEATDLAPLFDVMLDHGAEAYAVALDLMAMYAFDDLEKLDGLRPQVVKVAEGAGRWESVASMPTHDYHFEQVMGWMLEKGRADRDARSTALALARSLVGAEGIESAVRVRPLLRALLADFPEVVWPLIGQVIVSDLRARARAELMLGDPFSFGPRTTPALLHLPEDTLFAWCHAHPDRAPAFAAKIVPVLAPHEADGGSALHPTMARLLDEFGDRDDVRHAVESNIYTFGWAGSVTAYYARYEEPLRELTQHPNRTVSRWAKVLQHRLRESFEEARNEEEEEEASWEV